MFISIFYKLLLLIYIYIYFGYFINSNILVKWCDFYFFIYFFSRGKGGIYHIQIHIENN